MERRIALVVCGPQRALIDASIGSSVVHRRLARAAAAMRSAHGHVVIVRHGRAAGPGRPTAWLPVRGDAGWRLDIGTDAQIVDAAGWDGCYGSDLDHALRSRAIDTVVLCGFASELTVDSTIRSLNDRGYECLVLTDACAPLDAALGARAHASVTMSGGIFGALGTVEALVDLLESAVSDTTNGEDLKELTA